MNFAIWQCFLDDVEMAAKEWDLAVGHYGLGRQLKSTWQKNQNGPLAELTPTLIPS
jgi:hypothetical protein